MAEDPRRLFPMFRYHPFPVYTRAIEPQPITCTTCGTHRLTFDLE